MNVADVGGARDIPDLFPIMGVTTVSQTMEDLKDPPVRVMAIKSSALPLLSRLLQPQAGGALPQGKHWYLAGGDWRLTGAKRGTKMKTVSLIKLLAQEEETWVVTFPQGLRLYITVITMKEVESFPGRWEVAVWSPHRLTGPPGRLDIYNTLQHSPINHCMLRWTITYCFQAKTSLTESHDSCDLKKDLRIEYYHFKNSATKQKRKTMLQVEVSFKKPHSIKKVAFWTLTNHVP